MDELESSEVVEQDDSLVKPIDFEYTGDFFFSGFVLELVTKVFANDVRDFAGGSEDILNTDLTFNLPYLDIILDHLLVTKDVSYECTVEMNDYLEQVVPVIRAVSRHYDQVYQTDKTGAQLISIVEQHLYWLGNWKQYFIDAIHIALNDEAVFNIDLPEEPAIRNILALAIITRFDSVFSKTELKLQITPLQWHRTGTWKLNSHTVTLCATSSEDFTDNE